jgi:hypothetical protein
MSNTRKEPRFSDQPSEVRRAWFAGRQALTAATRRMRSEWSPWWSLVFGFLIGIGAAALAVLVALTLH